MLVFAIPFIIIPIFGIAVGTAHLAMPDPHKTRVFATSFGLEGEKIRAINKFEDPAAFRRVINSSGDIQIVTGGHDGKTPARHYRGFGSETVINRWAFATQKGGGLIAVRAE